MYESRKERPASRAMFRRRVARHAGASCLIVLGSLGLGMAGYMRFEGLAWTDAFLNAAMLLGGMGPVDKPVSEAGKIFAGAYALYPGLVVVVTVSIIAAPLVHRLLHKFHWEQ